MGDYTNSHVIEETQQSKITSLPNLSEDDISQIWQNVCEYIQNQMTIHKGVILNGLGIFTFNFKKVTINKSSIHDVRRPIFIVSEKFALTHGLESSKHFTNNDIPTIPLNFSTVAMQGPYPRDLVQTCIKEIVLHFSRAVQQKRSVEIKFNGIGKLSIRDGRTKMKFFREFVSQVSDNAVALELMQNRPWTADSVMTDRAWTARPLSRMTLVFPPAAPRGTLPPILEQEPIQEEEHETAEGEDSEMVATGAKKDDEMDEQINQIKRKKIEVEYEFPEISDVELMYKTTTHEHFKDPNERPGSFDTMPRPKRSKSPPRSAFSDHDCHHRGTGQELCYLCHQRRDRNVAISFKEEQAARDKEEDSLLLQYQKLRETEAVLADAEKERADKHETQKINAFNLGVAEAIKSERNRKDRLFYRSFLMPRRPMTPNKESSHKQYYSEILDQMKEKNNRESKAKEEKEFLERLENIQLSEDIIRQREQEATFLEKEQRALKSALDMQILYKPDDIPAKQEAPSTPIFGRADGQNPDKVNERRQRAEDVRRDQEETVANKRREVILKQLLDQRDQDEMLTRIKEEETITRARRHERGVNIRRSLEDSWAMAQRRRRARETEERRYQNMKSIPIHEQCDGYYKCWQCKRRLENHGNSNIYKDTRYIPGSRLMV